MRKGTSTEPVAQTVYPFSAIVGQEEMKLSLILNVIDPHLGGVLIMGHRGTGKSTAVRGLAALLPQMSVVANCIYRCDPNDDRNLCSDCAARLAADNRKGVKRKLAHTKAQPAVVELPLGATEDRVCGSIDIERALNEGHKVFEPGLLARANRGFLYIDEVNLLEDHLVDLLLDVSVTGLHKVERENISVEHPARFVLIGSGNPEEGELRPQLLDRFGLQVEITTENDPAQRLEIVERHQMFADDRDRFLADFAKMQGQLRTKIIRAQRGLTSVKAEREMLAKIAELCTELQLDGHRGEITTSRAARALAAFENRKKVTAEDVRRVASMALRHRLRRQPFEERGSGERINQALEKVFGSRRTEGSHHGGAAAANGARSKGPMSERGESNAQEKGRSASAKALRAQKELSQTSPLSKPANLRIRLSEVHLGQPHHPGSTLAPSGRNHLAKSKLNNRNGRYVRATLQQSHPLKLALDATLRAAAEAGWSYKQNMAATSNHRNSRLPLRFKQFSRKEGSLYVFAIDTSGSMALRRIDRAREVASSLLSQSYIKRDSVAIVVFRGDAAEVVLSPSKSILRAKRALDCLAMGGGTPLSAGILCAHELVKRTRRKHGKSVLLLFTDGQANVPLQAHDATSPILRRQLIAHELRTLALEFENTGMQTIVVDTQQRFRSPAELNWITEALGAELLAL